MAPAPDRYEVLLTQGATHDLEAIDRYLRHFDSDASADRVLDRLMAAAEKLSSFPERGTHPRELLALGIKVYRQVMFKPYRLIYQVVGHEVIVHLIADGRRDIQSLLARRLLAG